MIKYRGFTIGECATFASSVSEALTKAPDYFRAKDGVWYRYLGKGVAKASQDTTDLLNAMPLTQVCA